MSSPPKPWLVLVSTNLLSRPPGCPETAEPWWAIECPLPGGLMVGIPPIKMVMNGWCNLWHCYTNIIQNSSRYI